MACNSIATTSTTITQVILSNADLKALVSKLTGLPLDKIQAYGREDYHYAYVALPTGITIYLEQTVSKGKPALEFTIAADNSIYSAAQAKIAGDEWRAKYEPLLIKAQQTNVLKRLAELGKLSAVTGKPNGVVAKLEITL